MSEPMSNVEIEDVLSSIRRLVSDDLRPQARALRDDTPDVPAALAPAVRDKLVLTPALRIVAEPEPEPEPAFAPDAGPAAAEAPVFQTVRSVADVQAAFIAIDDDAPEAVLARDLPPDDAYDDDDAAAPVTLAVPIPDAVFAAIPDAVPEAAEWTDAAATSGADARAQDWADAAEAAVRAELEQDVPQSAFARFVDEPETAFDEAAMRDMVRDIIREELQGTLGERITRNVRKLVRAEIARALAVRDFE